MPDQTTERSQELGSNPKTTEFTIDNAALDWRTREAQIAKAFREWGIKVKFTGRTK